MQDREMRDADAEELASCRRHSPLAAVKLTRAYLQKLPLKSLRRLNARHASPFQRGAERDAEALYSRAHRTARLEPAPATADSLNRRASPQKTDYRSPSRAPSPQQWPFAIG